MTETRIAGARQFFSRQGTLSKWHPNFEFRPGPVFANVVLVDEINRAMPKTQSALLEAMAEQQVTVDGETRRSDRSTSVFEPTGCPVPTNSSTTRRRTAC